MKPHGRHLLIVIPSAVIGGAETLSLTLVSAMARNGVTVLTQRGASETFKHAASEVLCFDDFGLTAPYDYGFVNTWRYSKALTTVVKLVRPTVVYGVMQVASISLALASLRFPLTYSNIRRVGSIHGHVGAYLEAQGRQASIPERISAALMFSRLHGLIVPSKGVADDLESLFWGARGRTRVIYNGVDLDRVRQLAKQKTPVAKVGPWITMAARFGNQKDHLTLLHAFQKIHSETGAILVLVGDGEERSHAEKVVEQLGMAGCVIFTGFVKNPFPLLSLSDVVVLSSHYEGFGLVLVEAMALGKPVVATNCPSGPAEIIRDGVDGYLVAPRDADQLADRLRKLLSNDKLRAEMGSRGKKRSEIYSQDKMLDDYNSIFFGNS